MTKAQFDSLTKINYGERMASDTRMRYRQERKLPERGERAPLLERRAAYLKERGMSPLWIGSPLRAPAVYNAFRRKVIFGGIFNFTTGAKS